MRGQLTRQLVVETTRQLVVERGLAAVSLRRVATELGVTAPALYAYVDSKDDLLRAIAEVEFRRLIDRFEAIHEADPVDRNRALCEAYVTQAAEQPELFDVMFLFPPELAVAAATGRELPLATKAFNIAVDAVAEAIERGDIARSDPLVAALALWTGVHGVATVARLGFSSPEGRDLRELLLAEVVDTLLAGMRAVPDAAPDPRSARRSGRERGPGGGIY